MLSTRFRINIFREDLPCTWVPSDWTYSFLSMAVLWKPSLSCNSPHSTHHMIVHSPPHAVPQVPWKQLFLAIDPGILQVQLSVTPGGLLSQNLRYADDGQCCPQVGLHLHISFQIMHILCLSHNAWRVLKQMNSINRNNITNKTVLYIRQIKYKLIFNHIWLDKTKHKLFFKHEFRLKMHCYTT
jgi:hypothetical protein